MKLFLICSVRGASPEIVKAQEEYVESLERNGHSVHFPPRDTDQSATGLEICRQNAAAILACDEVHVFYLPESQGTHFDMGVAFALNKPIHIAHSIGFGPGKSYARMLTEWERSAQCQEREDGASFKYF
jgi:nucleoside 2-deoxyribosyltransferase